MRALWGRFVAWLRRLFGREAVPGYFEAGSERALRGWEASAPWLWPSREYLVYVPRNHSNWRRAPLVVLLHGCKQTPEDIARGTRIVAFADARGCIVLMPRQHEKANTWGCWNWFDQRTAAGAGEAAIVAKQIRAAFRRFRIDRKRVVVAGMSSGGALAAVMGVRYPGLVRAVAVHSGLACGAAASPLSAIRVLTAGPDQDVAAIADRARSNAPLGSLPVPLLAIHGGADEVVVPRHARALVKQFLRLNGHPAATGAGTDKDLPAADTESRSQQAGGRELVAREWRIDSRLVARYFEVPALAHAWAGGDEVLPYNDAKGPDATAMLGEFIDEVLK